MALINGSEKRMERQSVLDAGRLYVPVSFVKKDMRPVIGAGIEERKPVVTPSEKFSIKTIVLDPGHGGKDVGAIGRKLHLRESHMTLSLARKLRALLQNEGIRIVMTRDSDVFIPLPKRAEIANRSGADLFVSVHINASRSKSLRGFECYFLSNATDDNALALAASKNSTLKLSDNAAMERSKQLDKTLWDMALTENRRVSSELAASLCDSIDKDLTMGNRGVRSARFYVLKYTRIPAVLVEAGYISNRYEESKLKDPKFIDRIADALAKGILRYKREYESTDGFTISG